MIGIIVQSLYQDTISWSDVPSDDDVLELDDWKSYEKMEKRAKEAYLHHLLAHKSLYTVPQRSKTKKNNQIAAPSTRKQTHFPHPIAPITVVAPATPIITKEIVNEFVYQTSEYLEMDVPSTEVHNINIFLLCYNEAFLIPHTVKHYKKYLPSCTITIYDNESTDNSVAIATELGCNIVSWNSNNIFDEDKQIYLRNNIWKNCKKGWIIMADMDEFVCITEEDLLHESRRGVTILQIAGYDMIGESETVDISDIDLQEIKKYVDNPAEGKNLCFLREAIKDINYGVGSHSCKPIGKTIYSSKVYINKHMSMLGLPFLKNRFIERHKRSEKMRKKGWMTHYTQDIVKIENMYLNAIHRSKLLT